MFYLDLRTIIFKTIASFPHLQILALKNESACVSFHSRRGEPIRARQVENVSSIVLAILWYIAPHCGVFGINYLVTRLINPFQAPLFSHRVGWFCVGAAALCLVAVSSTSFVPCHCLINNEPNRWKIFMPIKREIHRVPPLETDVFLPAELQFFSNPLGEFHNFEERFRKWNFIAFHDFHRG